MNKYRIRFNKSRGTPNRGRIDHAWRVFENEQEYLFKHFVMEVPAHSEKEVESEDWNVVCEGYLHINHETSTATIKTTPPEEATQ